MDLNVHHRIGVQYLKKKNAFKNSHLLLIIQYNRSNF